MQDVVAPVDNIVFDIEIALNNQLGAQPLPFPGMDSEFLLKNIVCALILHYCNVLLYCLCGMSF